jgi:hypothetical protein
MLKAGDSDSLDLVDGLRTVSGTDALIDRIEHFDFISAVGILAGIRRELENDKNG